MRYLSHTSGCATTICLASSQPKPDWSAIHEQFGIHPWARIRMTKYEYISAKEARSTAEITHMLPPRLAMADILLGWNLVSFKLSNCDVPDSRFESRFSLIPELFLLEKNLDEGGFLRGCPVDRGVLCRGLFIRVLTTCHSKWKRSWGEDGKARNGE